MNWEQILGASLILFAVIDIIGNIPVIVELRKRAGDISSGKATLVALGLMIAFLFAGERMLNLIGINVGAFAVAGSIIIFIIAMEMILGVKLQKSIEPRTVSIVPIAFPLIAGAGTLTTLLSLRAEYHTVNIIIAVLLNMLIVYGVLKATKQIEEFLGEGLIGILEKVFGVILLAIAVKLFGENIGDLIK
ncbi:MAG: MarC family protein [Saprospiraceae bacterium]|nr:MarC family protein [Saprospiraceae bacterium]